MILGWIVASVGLTFLFLVNNDFRSAWCRFHRKDKPAALALLGVIILAAPALVSVIIALMVLYVMVWAVDNIYGGY